MSEFFLRDARKAHLLHTLRKHAPERAEYFLNTCEREIVSWLKAWPQLPPPAQDARQQLERVRNKALELFEAVKSLDDTAGFVLVHFLLSHKDDDTFQGVEPADVWPARTALECDLLRLSFAAGECHGPFDGPPARRPDQDLCDRLARIYTETFRELPSANMEDGVFAAFCEEIANDLPSGASFTVSRTILERSRERSSYLLEDSLR